MWGTKPGFVYLNWSGVTRLGQAPAPPAAYCDAGHPVTQAAEVRAELWSHG